VQGHADKLKLGLFVAVSFILGLALVIWLGASQYFVPTQTAAAYFAESVQGLEKDSPVKFRGVTVGRVNSIRMAKDARLVEVIMALDKGFRITDDLGVKIGLLGITGQKYLEMDSVKPADRRDPFPLDVKPSYPVITSYPSDISEFGSALENIFRKVKAVDIERISLHLLRISSKLDKMLSDSNIETIGADAAEAMRELKKTAAKLNDELDKLQLSKKVPRSLDKATDFFQEATQTARTADQMIRRTDNNIAVLSQKIERSADNLVEFTRMLKVKPSSILFGSPEKEADKK
jgi:phospholipid/cholesterol/gamma-HCH transport system substrate-binding protein